LGLVSSKPQKKNENEIHISNQPLTIANIISVSNSCTTRDKAWMSKPDLKSIFFTRTTAAPTVKYIFLNFSD
jgi:hypothetical protein